ncbi:MAG: DinB family protein [Saprospiraceae bacterium]|nr:DinB family protein [Saprospiraceae bacterium]
MWKFYTSDIDPMPAFFDRYILLVEDLSLMDAFRLHTPIFTEEEIALVKEFEDFAYAPGKWTVKEVIQHLTDNDRVQSYRALRISRGDTTVLPGYDQDVLASHHHANERFLEDLLEEHQLVRQSVIKLFESMSEEDLLRVGNANGNPITAPALGFQIIGHQIYHKRILHERYFQK